jgi:lipopolysaccharide heptosyltransferase II
MSPPKRGTRVRPHPNRFPRAASGNTSPDKRYEELTWSSAREVLCIRLDTLGDVLMMGPAMRALREGGRRVTLMTSPSGAAVGELMPEVDELIVYEAPWMKATPPRGPAPDRALIDALAARAFDAAVILTTFSQSPLPAALTCWHAEIPLRLAHCRENPYQLLTDWIRETDSEQAARHEVRRQLDLVATVGAFTDDERLAVAVPPPARERVDALLDEAGVVRSRRWAVVHPGATAPSRRYPAELWSEACRALVRDHGLQLVLTGDEREGELADELRASVGGPVSSLAGRLELAALAALLEAAPLLLAGNTGPVHVAAAVGTPVVDLYALTNPQHTPWEVASRVLSHDVPCRWCFGSVCREGHHLCLRGVAPEEVVRAALELLGA